MSFSSEKFCELINELKNNGVIFSFQEKNQYEKEESVFVAVAYINGFNFMNGSPLKPVLKQLRKKGVVDAATNVEDKNIINILDVTMDICDALGIENISN